MSMEDKPIVTYNTFYESWHKAMKKLSLVEYGELTKAMNEYCFYGKEPELEGILDMLFTVFRPSIDASTRNKLNGKTGGKKGNGGAPEGNQNARKKDNSPLLNNQYPPINKNNSNAKEKENVNENVKENGDGNTNSSASALRVCESSDPKELFLNYWQHNPDIFNALSRIEAPKEWDNFWENSDVTCQQVKTVMENVITDVKCGTLEPRISHPHLTDLS